MTSLNISEMHFRSVALVLKVLKVLQKGDLICPTFSFRFNGQEINVELIKVEKSHLSELNVSNKQEQPLINPIQS